MTRIGSQLGSSAVTIALTRACGATLAGLGALKLAWLPILVTALEGWSVIPSSMRVPAALGLAASEFGIGLLLLIAPRDRGSLGAGVFLSCVLIFGAGLRDESRPPSGCGCLGVASDWVALPAWTMPAVAWGSAAILCMGLYRRDQEALPCGADP